MIRQIELRFNWLSVRFLNYLRYQLGYRWSDIVQAAGSTLEQNYQNVTGRVDGLTPFKTLLQVTSQRTPSGIRTDNPFPFSLGTEAWYGWENQGGYCLVGPASASWDINRLNTFDRRRSRYVPQVVGWFFLEWLGKPRRILSRRTSCCFLGTKPY